MAFDLNHDSTPFIRAVGEGLDKWDIFSTEYRNNKPFAWNICGGINRYGDGPERDVCRVVSSREDAEAICAAHNATL